MECLTPVSPKNHHPLPDMTSIDNSSAAKFLALFCIPALLLASAVSYTHLTLPTKA